MKKVLILSYFSFLFSFFSFSQNVGIGITNPTRAKLELNGAVDATTAIFGGESSGISLQRNWPGVGFNSYWNGGDRALASGYSAKFHLDPGSGHLYMDMLPFTTANILTGVGNRAITINSSGYVGIGGATPNAPLQFANTQANRKIVLWETANNNHQFYGLGIESGTMRYSVAGAGNVHRFYSGTSTTSSNLLMSIWADRTVIIGDDNGGGKLGINQSNPAHTLSIRQAGGTGISLEEPASGDVWSIYAYNGGAATGLFFNYNFSNVSKIQTNGNYLSFSDKRLKTNIEKMPPVLQKLMLLKPSVYEFKAHNPCHEKSIGFIAQEVKILFPELVSIQHDKMQNGISDLHAMNYSGFGVLAIKAIQEQQQQIEEMKKEIELLKEQNKMLMQLLIKKN